MEPLLLPPCLSEAIVPNLPDTVYYLPNFITEAEEAHLLSKINSAPLPTWRHLSHRRLQAQPSVLSPSNTLLATPLPAWLVSPIITRLQSIPLTLSSTPPTEQQYLFSTSPHLAPNHVLINEYTPGQGIFPHEDGDAYHPIVATISLGSHIVLDIYPKKGDGTGEREERPKWRILQEPKSLLVTMGKCYTETLHGIGEADVDEGLCGGEGGVCNWDLLGDKGYWEGLGGKAQRKTRVSLTYRDVLRVKTVGKAFLGLKR